MGRSQNDENPTIVVPGTSGKLLINDAAFTANGSANVTISNVAPALVGTATISKWLTFTDDAGLSYFIPCWT